MENIILTENEQKAKNFMFDYFIPALHQMIEDINPKEYQKWGRNCCRQTAIYGAYFLESLLPEYTWTVWDGNFDDILNGQPVKYNHAWIFGKNKEGRRLLVDLARIYTERLFTVVSNNKYPKDHPHYINMKEINREQLDWKQMIENDTEYYTGLKREQFLLMLNEYMKGLED